MRHHQPLRRPARRDGSALVHLAARLTSQVLPLLALAVALAVVAAAAAVFPPTQSFARANSTVDAHPAANATSEDARVEIEHADRGRRPSIPHHGAAAESRAPETSAPVGGVAPPASLASSAAVPASSASGATVQAVEAGSTQTDAATFPGDPGPGHVIFGAAVGLNSDPHLRHEVTTGTALAIHRIYFSAGASDLAVPSGPVARAVLADQAAGRIPLVSVKPGPFASTAAGAYDSQFRAFFAWTEAQPKFTYLIVNHEPENDMKGAPMAAQVQMATDFRLAQERVRADLDAVTGGHARRTSFGGSLMTYGDTPYAQKAFAPWDQFFPSPGTWDWAGMDFYTEPTQSPDRQEWIDAVAAASRHQVRLAVTELGFRATDPLAADRLKAFYEEAVQTGIAFVSYFDSDQNGAYANTWTLQGSQLAEFHALMTDPRSTSPNL